MYVGRIDKEEIDFIIEKEKDKKYVQAAYLLSNRKVIEREFGSLEKTRDAYEKIVVSMDDISLGSKNGIKHWRAWEI